MPMFFQSTSGDQDIIHVDEDGTGENEIFEQLIHHGLKRGGGVHKAKKHYEWFEHSAIGFERGFPLISGTNANVVISQRTSNFVKTRAFFSLSMTSEIRGRGY